MSDNPSLFNALTPIYDESQANSSIDAISDNPFDRVMLARQQRAARVEQATQKSIESLNRHRNRYQEQQTTAGKLASLGTDSDAVRTVVGGAVSGVGSVVDGFGRVQEMMNGPNLSEPLKALGQKLQEAGDFARGSVSLKTQRAIDDSRITGDVFDPESWDFGVAPSAEGYAYQLLGVLGEFAPQAAGLLAKSPKAAQGIMGLIGFMQAGSGQAQDAAEYLGSMDDETFFNNIELAQTLREANPNMTDAEIRQEVTRTAEATSMLVGGAVGGIGGAATGYILRPMQKSLPGNALARGVTSVGISGFEEGVQETAEPVLSRAVTNAVIGDDRDTTEGTLEGAVLGTSFGGGLGAGGAVVEEVGRKLKDVQQKNAERMSKEKKQNVGIVSAITEGRFEDLTDPTKREDYPRNVTTSALGKVALDEKVEPEVRKQASDALASIESEIAREIKNEQSVADGLVRRTETLNETQELLDEYTQQLKEAKASKAAPEEINELQETVNFLQEDLDAVKAEIDTGPKPDSKRMAALQQELTTVSELRKNSVVESTKEDLSTLVSQVSAPDTPDDVRATSTQKLLSTVQTNPDALDVDQLKALGSPNNRSLTDDDRRFIRQLTAAKVQENTLKSMDTVGADIFTDQPDRGYISLPKYKSLISGALQKGDIDSATKSLEMLESFMKDHKAKAANARTALKNAQQSGKDQVVLADRSAEGGWRTEERTGFWTKGRLKEKGSLYIGANQKKLVDQISKEAQVISSNYAVLKKAIERTSTQQPESASTSEVPTTPVTSTSDKSSDLPPWEDESTSGAAETSTSTQEPTNQTKEEVTTEPAPVRNEADQQEMEKEYPGILPWETLEEYQERTKEQEVTTRKLQGPVMRGQDPEEMSSIQLKKVTETLAERFGKSQELIALGGKPTEDMDVLRQDLKLLADIVLVEAPEAVRSLFDLMVSKDTGVTLDELVEWGTKNATNRAQRGLLKALSGHAKVKDVRAFTLYTLDLVKTAESSKDSGMYFPSTHTIGIDPLTMTRGQNTQEFAVDTVIHEMIHAVSYDRIANDPEFRKEIDEISDIIRDWMKNNDTSVLYDSGAFEYAISDPNGQELLSTFFGSPRLMADLQRIPDPAKKQNVFQKFVTALKKTIQRAFPGMAVAEANIMDRVMALGNELFQDSLFDEVFESQSDNADPAPIRNDASQQEMEETHPGILPWESVEEYEQRIIEEDGAPETPQTESTDTVSEEAPVTKYTMTQLRSEIIPQQGNELTFGEVLKAIKDSGFIPVFRSMNSPDGDVVRVDAANKTFQFRGLTFAAHKVEGLWVVTELGTGLNTGKFQKTQKGTIELAKERLGQASEGTIKKFIDQSDALGVVKLQERYLAQDGDVTAEEPDSPSESATTDSSDTSETSDTTETSEPEKVTPVYWFQQTPLEPFSGQMTADEIRSLNKMTYFTVSTNRALTKVPNFFSTTLSQAKRDLSVLAPFIRGGIERLEKLQQKENLEEYLDTVITHMDAFNKQIDKMFVNSAVKDKFGNPLSYLANPETGQLDENTKTAISQAALAFVLENGNDVWSNSTDKELRAVLLLDETDPIDRYARAAVRTSGRRHNSVVQELGRRAYQAAGLKIRPDAPKNEEQQIMNAMGEMALSVLFSKTEASQQPYMHRYGVNGYVFDEEFRNYVRGSGLLEKFRKDKRSLTKEENAIVSKYYLEEHFFVRSNRIADDRDVNTFHKNLELQRLKELAKGTQNFLDDVFGVEHTKVLATTEPVEFTQKRAKNSPGLVPSKLAEAVNTDNHRAIKLDGDLLRKDENNPGIFHKISRELLGFIAGKEETEGRNIHRLNRDGIQGKNDAIDREIEQLLDDTLEDLLEGDIEKPFYTQKTVWKMHRVGHTSNTFNAQNSKLHRYSAHLDGWEYEVDAKNPDDKNHQEFKLALMDALGEKTDNESPEKVLERFSKSIMENETFMAAMPVMRALLTDPDYRIEDHQSAEAQTILAALNEAGEGAHSFAGLLNLAKYLEAQNGTGTFTTTLSREGDGKNNGPIISNLMMGLPADAEGQDALMNMGGIFTEGQEYANYGDYAEKVGLDLYKKLASSANERMQEKLEGLENPKEFAPLRLIHAVIGNFVDEETGNVTSAGRTAVKQPLTSMIFGAGVAGTIDNMGGDFVHGIYTLFEQAYGDPEQVRLLLSGLNEVMDWANSQRKYPKEPGTYRMATNQRNVLNTVFNEAQETLLSEAFKEILGQQIKESLEEQYGDFLENRSAMNNAANMTFRLYDFAYQHERRKMLAEIQEKTGNDYQDLTSEQEKELDKKVSRLFPMMHTAFSKASGQSHRYGLPLLKQKRGQAEEGNQYTVQTKFRNLNVLKFPVDKKKGPIIPLNSMKAEGVVFRYVEPGAGTVVLATHSTDTYPAAQVYMKYLALNSHDAVHGPAPMMPEMIQYMNETFLDAMGDTSIAENVMEALYRTMDEFVKWESEIVDGMSEEELAAWEQQKQEAIPPKERVYSKGGKFTEIPSSLSIEEHAALWLDKASAAHQRRNSFLSRVTKVSQYYVGGGDFNVPDAKRQELQKKLEGDTLATQLMKQRAKRLGRDPVHIQNRLNEVIASGEARINDNSGKLTKQVIQTLREITVAQHKHGDLNKALGVVLRGPENSEARDFYRSIIMGGSPVWNSWIEGNQTILDQVVELKEIHKKKKRPQGSYTPGSANNIKNYTTQEMLSALSQKEGLTKGHATELATLMDSIVNNLHGIFGAKKAAIEAKSGETPVDLLIRSEQEGVYPFTTKAAGSGVALNSAERFVVEQIELAMRETFDGKSLADREFLKLFREARNTIKPEDLHPGDPDKAQEIYDFIFRLDTSIGDNRSTHLSRFVALGLVYPPLKKALDFVTAEPDARKGDKVGDRLQHGFETAVQMLSNEVNKTYTGERANKRMEALVTRLVYNEKKHKLSETKKESSTLREVERLVEKARKNSNETIAKIANSPTLTEHKYKTVRTGAKLTAILAEDRADELLKALEDFRNHEFRKKPLGFFMSTLNEIRGETEETTGFYQALAKTGQIEQERKNILENLRKEFLERFDNHKDLTKQEKAGITQVFLRNDLSSLLDGRSSERVLQLVRNRRELDKEIQNMTKQVVANNRFAGYHMHAIKDLAYYLATGRNVSENLVLNAHNIAHLYGTPWAGKNTQAANQVQAIDQLVSLYALKYTPSEQRSAIRKVMEHERNRGDENALAYLLALHRGIKQDALQELFDGNPVQMMKGYTKEIYNPHIRVVATDSVNGQKLIEQGWERITKLSMDDSLDSRTGLNDEHLYVVKDAGLQDYVTGILSNTGMQAKGTEDIRGSYVGNSQHQTTLRNSRMKRIGLKKTPGIREMAKYQADYDPSKRKSGKLAPVFDDQGNVANYRYLMNHSTKDSVLERNNNFEDVLAGTAASQYDKLSSADHNKEVIQALHSFYKQDYAKNQNAWVEVSDESEDPRLREAYRLLPDATRQEIIKTFGQNKMFIHNDLLNLLLGYRKYSMSDVFSRESHERNALQNFLVDILEQLYGKQAALKVRRAEDMWQATVKLVKDVWVIRNLTTLLGNVMSNITLLLAYGVPPSALIQGHREAIEGLMTYQKTRNELIRVQANQKAGVGNLDEQAEKIRELEFELDRNPVKDLVDAGMFQTIMEDIDAEKDDYNYESLFDRTVNDWVGKLPEPIKKTGEVLTVGKDTTLYKVLFKGTQMSDFVGRYVLYNHLKKKEGKTLTNDQILKRVREAFVNYDAPTHRSMQYGNDMGLIFFTKYYMRIQKVIWTLMHEHPARALGVVVASNYLGGLSHIFNSSALGRVGNNPFDVGAVNITDMASEPIPLKILLSFFD